LTSLGEPRVPLLPKPLRDLWAEERLPDWIASECCLPLGSTLAALDASVWNNLPAYTPRIERYVLALLDTRYDTIRDLPALTRPWPVGLDPASVPWTTRTKNCLARVGALSDRNLLAHLTFGDLYNISGMGTASVVDFTTIGEAAIDLFESDANKQDKQVSEALTAISDEQWIDTVMPDDPRFTQYFTWLLSPKRHVDDIEADAEASGLNSDLINVSILLLGLHSRDAFSALLNRVRAIQQMPLDVALRDYMEALCFNGANKRRDSMRVEMLLARLGLGGAERPLTLQECAELLKVTRERCRQIQNSALSRKPPHPVYMPALDRALEVLAQHAPIDVNDAAQLLVQQGITTIPFRPESVLAAAQFCGRTITFPVEQGLYDARVVMDSSSAFANPIASLAARLATSSGASNISAVNDAAVSEDIDVSIEQVRDVLQHHTSAQFLDDTEDWFWIPDGTRNRLSNTTLRMLAVASPLDIRTIREGVQRHYRHRSQIKRQHGRPLIVPPRVILTAFFARNPTFILEGDKVRPKEPPNLREVLGETEQIMVDVLRSTPAGILDRHTFAAACLERGMKPTTFSVFLSASAVIEHVDTGIWGLRGIHIDPVEVERLRVALAMRPRERRLVDFGWTDNGNLWLAMRLPNLSIASYTHGIPTAILPYVAGRQFRALTRDNREVGTVVVDERGASWGYGPFLAREGADEGDILYTEFNLVRGTAMLELEPEDFLEASSESAV
jgi:hypothetical protein